MISYVLTLRRYSSLKNNNAHSLLFICESLLGHQVIVNWVFHSRHFVESSLREIVDNSHGNQWLVHLIQDYVVGGKDYIEKASDFYRNTRQYGVGQ